MVNARTRTHTHARSFIRLPLPISGHMSSHQELANTGREPTKEMKRMHTVWTNCILRIWSKESKNTEQIFVEYPLCKNLPFTKIMPVAPEIGSTRWLQVCSLFLPRHSLPTPLHEFFLAWCNPPSGILLHNYTALPILVSPAGWPSSSLPGSGNGPSGPSGPLTYVHLRLTGHVATQDASLPRLHDKDSLSFLRENQLILTHIPETIFILSQYKLFFSNITIINDWGVKPKFA